MKLNLLNHVRPKSILSAFIIDSDSAESHSRAGGQPGIDVITFDCSQSR